MNPTPSQPAVQQLPVTASPSSLPAMNSVAAESAKGTAKGVAQCKQKKHWFGLILLLVDDKGKSSPLGDVTVGLKIPDLGEIERVTQKSSTPVKVDQLEPGGTGDVLQLQHANNVYEAVGDFS